MNSYQKILDAAKAKQIVYKKVLSKLRDKKIKDLDNVAQLAHDEVFERIDCLQCANCCKTTSPIFYDKDIERLAAHVKVKPVQFILKYLQIDTDGDYVLHKSPCVFLGQDNCCSVYEARPKACREYPHTNRKNFYQLTQLTLNNTLICPAAVGVVDKLKAHYKL